MKAVPGAVHLRKQALAAAIFSVLAGSFAAYADAPTYYVSTTGSDSNNGLTPQTAWATVAKVDATSASFTPGTSVLFQRGDVWSESLVPQSSGTVGDPITYSAYGDASAAKPEFLGSDVVTGFTAIDSSMYVTSTAPLATEGAVYLNHNFLDPADQLSTTPIQYVDATPDSYYYDTASSVLYLNTGGVNPNTATITATRRTSIVNSNGQSNLVFDNLQTDETAAVGGGFGFQVSGGANITISNSDAFRAAKHHFSVVNSTGFLGENLNAEYTMPDQTATGGAIAYVAYGDQNGPAQQTSEWDNISASNLGGAGAFISHGPNIAKVVVNNLNAPDSSVGFTDDLQNGAVTMNGGTIGDIYLATSGSTIDGTHIINGTVYLSGSNDTIQNVVMNGMDATGAYFAGFVVSGANNVLRFNTTIMQSSRWDQSQIYLLPGSTGTSIYGNIFTGPGYYLHNATGNVAFSVYSNHNLFASAPSELVDSNPDVSYSQWQAQSFDDSSIVGDPQFNDPADGDFSLQSTSPAIGPYTGAFWQLLAHDAFGNPRPSGDAIDLGAIETPPAAQTIISASSDSDLGAPGAAVSLNNATLQINSDTFTSTNRQIILGINGGTIEIDSPTNSFAISGSVGGGPLNKIGVGTLVLTQSYNNSAVTLISEGTLQLTAPTNSTSEIFGAGTLAIGPGAALVSAGIAVVTLKIDGNVQIAPNGSFDGTSVVSSLLLDGSSGNWTTGIDLTNNHLVVEDSTTHAQTVAQLRDQAAYGLTHNAGIYSSTMLPGQTIAVVDNAYFGQTFFAGTDVDAGSVIVYATYNGDANLDGLVDIRDLSSLALHWQQAIPDWSAGDFNGDGMVNIQDLQILANNWQDGVGGKTGGSGSADLESMLASFEGVASVPEPASVALLFPAALLLSRRRARK